MSMTIARTTANAKIETEQPCGNRRRALRLNAAVMRKSRDLFCVKTAMHLSDITGYSVRACENWLSERVVIPSDALALLLHSEWGRDFLAVVMADNTPKWWRRFRAWLEAVDDAEIIRKIRRKQRDQFDADFAPAPSFAQMLYDPEFNGAQVAPARRIHRTMVQKGRVK